MELLTPEIIQALPKLRETRGEPLETKKVICKFYSQDSLNTWYVIEGQPSENGEDFVFLGVVFESRAEVKCFTLSELRNFRGPLGMPLMCDTNVFKVPVHALIKHDGLDNYLNRRIIT